DDAPGAPLRRVVAADKLVLDAAQEHALAQLVTLLRGDAVIVIEGPRGSGRSTAVARASGRPVVELDGARRERIDQQALLELRREVALGVAQPVIANADRLPAELGLGAFLDASRGSIVVTSAMPGLDLGTERPIVRVRWPLPEAPVRRTLWEQAAREPTGDLDTLAFRYRVGAGVVHRAVASVRAEHGSRALDATDLMYGLRHNIAEDLGGLAHPVEVTQSWEDLVLAEDTRDHVQALIARVRHAHQVLATWQYRSKIARGTGVPALFSGPPGTGKTMVAGLIARELDLELYQVDLAQVVSKWVGETEKQLARVFDAAEQGHALLLFDEADALFGKRSADMKGANDRYANLEVNYLLQRVEAFGGITILTTNLDTAIDPALKRRLAAHVVFELPDDDERTTLWQRNVTTRAAPLADGLDFEQLSRTFPKMSGANIRNAALAAAFLAAADGTPTITQQHLLRAGRAEYRSMGHVLAERRAP
ncbi:MAG TPA: ATP-binding protein, partial [Kofleriaceae bacterium]|nr:ATP-binding protein [Kofleriaceae bacterium]